MTASTRGYRADIDGLRAVAVTAVAVFHAFPGAAPGGFIGVDVFFVISGYLITGILLGQAGAPAQTLREFYVRRIRRIFPALIVLLAAVGAFASMFLFASELRRLGKLVAASAAFVPNVALWLEGGYFDTSGDVKPLIHLWSLGIEEQFYLAWPALLLAGRRFGKGRGLAVLTAFLIAASFLAGLRQIRADAFAAFYWPQSRAWELLAGAALAQAAHARLSLPLPGWTREISSWGGAVLILAGTFAWPPGAAFPGAWALVPVGGAAAILAAGPRASLNRACLAWRPLVGIGLVSYPWYLWHWPMLSFAHILAGGTPAAPVRAGCLAASLMLAVATYLWIEKPFRRAPRRGATAALCLGMALIFAAGSALFLSGGWPGRAVNRPFAGPSARPTGRSVPLDRICLDSLGAAPGPKEFCKAKSGRPRFLFLGDSHAIALYSAIDVGTYALPAVLVAGRACRLYPGLETAPEAFGSYESQCDGIAADGLRIAAANPSIAIVIITQRALNPDSLSPFRQDGRRLTNGEAFRIGQRIMIDSLKVMGKRVLLVADVPDFAYTPDECEARGSFPALRDCRMSRPAYLRSRAALAADLERLREGGRGPALFDPAPVFCDPVFCSMKQGGRWFYEDRDHLNPSGSLAVLQALEKGGFLETSGIK